MKTTIFYFSATGNSLHVARLLAEKLSECTLVSIASLRDNEIIMAATERVGFVFPTHYFGLPPIVSTFISRIDMDKVQYSFAVVTNGSSRYFSSALNQVEVLLAKKERKLDAGFHVEMISSYIPLSDIPPTEKMNRKLAEADRIIEKIAHAVLTKKSIHEGEHLWAPFNAINKYWKNNRLSQAHRKFSCTDACISCGNCKKVCPVNNIRLQDGKPKWLDNCQECLACLHFCPEKSIEFGGRTVGRKRYHHPKILAADIINSK
ncbi:MAG: hypothetical protein K0R55_2284 [Sporomusa sp.]|nr:hypothetical protein [Sporomusa sp.]